MTVEPTGGNASQFEGFGEKIVSDHLPQFNLVLGTLFSRLREGRSVQADFGERLGAIVTLLAVTEFLLTFPIAKTEGLHLPLLALSSALVALRDNKVMPILIPAKASGRSASSPQHYAFIGVSVGSARRLELTGIRRVDANRAVAEKLAALGVKPGRGAGKMTQRTVQGWREHTETVRPLLKLLGTPASGALSAEDVGWTNALKNADLMLTQEDCNRIRGLGPAQARAYIVLALENYVRNVGIG